MRRTAKGAVCTNERACAELSESVRMSCRLTRSVDGCVACCCFVDICSGPSLAHFLWCLCESTGDPRTSSAFLFPKVCVGVQMGPGVTESHSDRPRLPPHHCCLFLQLNKYTQTKQEQLLDKTPGPSQAAVPSFSTPQTVTVTPAGDAGGWRTRLSSSEVLLEWNRPSTSADDAICPVSVLSSASLTVAAGSRE
jgi:hypothetical protein